MIVAAVDQTRSHPVHQPLGRLLVEFVLVVPTRPLPDGPRRFARTTAGSPFRSVQRDVGQQDPRLGDWPCAGQDDVRSAAVSRSAMRERERELAVAQIVEPLLHFAVLSSDVTVDKLGLEQRHRVDPDDAPSVPFPFAPRRSEPFAEPLAGVCGEGRRWRVQSEVMVTRDEDGRDRRHEVLGRAAVTVARQGREERCRRAREGKVAVEAVDISQVSRGRVQRFSKRRCRIWARADSLFLVNHLGPGIEQVAQPNDRIDPASALASAQPTDGPPALPRIQVGHLDPEPL